MRLTTEQHEAIAMAMKALTGLMYCEESNPIERAYLVDTRTQLEAVLLMPYGDDK